MPPRESHTPPLARGRKLLTAGAIVQTLGLAIVGTSPSTIGSWVVLGGWILLIYGLHAFGRAGDVAPAEK